MLNDQRDVGMSAQPFPGVCLSDPIFAQRTSGSTAKRVLDLFVAVTSGVLLSPLILFVAIMIKLSMDGPVIFGQSRVGLRGQEFYCYKFRTMVCDADHVLQEYLNENSAAAEEWARTRKLCNDPRITFVGRLLRSASLDELPQLLNVLRGEMSCVGPRPIVRDEVVLYGPMADYYMSVRPGMTGAWQVSGRSSLSYAERVAIDADYVRKWSFWTDVVILFRTIPALLRIHQTS